MTDLYPLQIVPEFVERVWGTHDVGLLYQHSVGIKPIGEVWLTGGQCRVANGPLKGRTIEDLSRTCGEALTGEVAHYPDRFPLLMKVLFPREKLSVQVHPDDAVAQAAGEPCGKTECWYILKADEGAQIGLGFQPGTTREQIERSIHEGRMEHLLNWIDVRAGEMYYVDAGTVHAIGPGSVIIETQQNSDTTYRLYDYGRPRELHIDRGLTAMKLSTHAGRVTPRKIAQHRETLVASPSFTVERQQLTSEHSVRPGGNVQCIFAMDGAARIESPGAQPLTIARGEMAIIPAALHEYSVFPQWTCDLLYASVPAGEIAEPETELYVPAAASAQNE